MKKSICRVLALCASVAAVLVMVSALVVTAAYATGDVNGDEVVNTSDVRVMLRHLVKGEPLTQEQLLLADVNGNGVVDTKDVREVLETLAQQTATPTASATVTTPAPVTTTTSATFSTTITTTTTVPQTTTTSSTTTTTIAMPTTATTTVPPCEVEVLAEELRMFEMINEERAKVGVAPLRFAYEDYQCVKLRAAEQNIIFGHVRPNGERAKSVYTDFGMEIPAVGGENVVKYCFSPEDGMDGLMESPGHKANILDTDYTAVSVGMDYTPEGLLIFVQLSKK